MKEYKRIKARISLDAIAENFEQMHRNIREDTKMIAVIKADGYGHGAVPIARLIHDYDYIWGFATATAQEALQLRKAGITKPILILGIVFEEYFDDLVKEDVRIAVTDYEMAQKYAQAGSRQNRQAKIHIALDTGMTRIGFSDTEKSAAQIQKIAQLENLYIEGMFTHFARADETDRSPAMVQLERYLKFAGMLRDAGVEIPICHCSNSAGIIRIPEANLNVVRAGITIYGIYPSDEVEKDIVRLKPAMELISHVSYVKNVAAGVPVSYGGTYVTEKETTVATIPVGYADGYPRLLSNKGWVLIRGQKAPVLGRVCMDQFMVDVSHIEGVRAGDPATLLGKDGDEEITVEMLGALSGRFPYEFVCDITKRVPRVYVRDNREVEEINFFD
ncbi:MAG: alanine racemase [Blautia sp.]|nr:alanine racemase [Blautia sp.]MDY5031965.1 alanine racemase [Blautia sp.]